MTNNFIRVVKKKILKYSSGVPISVNVVPNFLIKKENPWVSSLNISINLCQCHFLGHNV